VRGCGKPGKTCGKLVGICGKPGEILGKNLWKTLK
jgi:hypothetical protein